MDILEYRDYCLSLPFVEESTPFDETTLVFKVGGRMFTYAGMEDFFLLLSIRIFYFMEYII